MSKRASLPGITFHPLPPERYNRICEILRIGDDMRSRLVMAALMGLRTIRWWEKRESTERARAWLSRLAKAQDAVAGLLGEVDEMSLETNMLHTLGKSAITPFYGEPLSVHAERKRAKALAERAKRGTLALPKVGHRKRGHLPEAIRNAGRTYESCTGKRPSRGDGDFVELIGHLFDLEDPSKEIGMALREKGRS